VKGGGPIIGVDHQVMVEMLEQPITGSGKLSWNALIAALGWQIIRSCARKMILKRL
jgi:hypothetical protein